MGTIDALSNERLCMQDQHPVTSSAAALEYADFE
jgi:hypothetical protein